MYAAKRIGLVDMADGQSIINYDAALTAITAIRRIINNSNPMPSLRDVIGEWHALNGVLKIHGASGWICLDNSGNPYDKAIPIVTYTRDRKPAFVQLAWPDNSGLPPPADCIAPPGD